VVAVLIEQGEHGSLAAGLASQVIKAYVDKQRRLGVKTAGLLPGKKEIEIAGVWNQPADHNDSDSSSDHMGAGRFKVSLSTIAKTPPRLARVIPQASSGAGGRE
jgi:hypothetical protein